MKKTENVLIIGSGGREHGLAWKIKQSPRCGKLYVAPGNAGTAALAENVPIPVTDLDALVAFALSHDIDLVVIGPDDVLAAGAVNKFRAAGIRVVGPTKEAAEIESSKAESKLLMIKAGVPTARAFISSRYDEALEYLRSASTPLYIKASGLALGKGAHECLTPSAAQDMLKAIMVDGLHGDAGKTVVIEEKLIGDEISGHVVTDGKIFKTFPVAQDHKLIGEGDTGENTGGMGSIVPIPWHRSYLQSDISELIARPILDELRDQGRPFTGCLFPGLMDTASGLSVIENNARFGDPEMQSYMRLLKSDFLDILDGCADGTLEEVSIVWRAGFAVCITLASEGYPGAYEKDRKISGIAEAESLPGVVVFHAGTAMKDGILVTNGGRVLGVSATGATLQDALATAYEAIKRIHFKGMYYRRDIGQKALKRAGLV